MPARRCARGWCHTLPAPAPHPAPHTNALNPIAPGRVRPRPESAAPTIELPRHSARFNLITALRIRAQLLSLSCPALALPPRRHFRRSGSRPGLKVCARAACAPVRGGPSVSVDSSRPRLPRDAGGARERATHVAGPVAPRRTSWGSGSTTVLFTQSFTARGRRASPASTAASEPAGGATAGPRRGPRGSRWGPAPAR